MEEGSFPLDRSAVLAAGDCLQEWKVSAAGDCLEDVIETYLRTAGFTRECATDEIRRPSTGQSERIVGPWT